MRRFFYQTRCYIVLRENHAFPETLTCRVARDFHEGLNHVGLLELLEDLRVGDLSGTWLLSTRHHFLAGHLGTLRVEVLID
jgi:hypothetical protein